MWCYWCCSTMSYQAMSSPMSGYHRLHLDHTYAAAGLGASCDVLCVLLKYQVGSSGPNCSLHSADDEQPDCSSWLAALIPLPKSHHELCLLSAPRCIHSFIHLCCIYKIHHTPSCRQTSVHILTIHSTDNNDFLLKASCVNSMNFPHIYTKTILQPYMYTINPLNLTDNIENGITYHVYDHLERDWRMVFESYQHPWSMIWGWTRKEGGRIHLLLWTIYGRLTPNQYSMPYNDLLNFAYNWLHLLLPYFQKCKYPKYSYKNLG